MQIVNNLHAFVWQSPTANNCNAYFIDGPCRVLIDPGHRALFEHVDLGLKELGLNTDDIDLVVANFSVNVNPLMISDPATITILKNDGNGGFLHPPRSASDTTFHRSNIHWTLSSPFIRRVFSAIKPTDFPTTLNRLDKKRDESGLFSLAQFQNSLLGQTLGNIANSVEEERTRIQ